MNNKADISLIRDYLNGKLDARAMYELERRAQDNPELMDLMLGMEMGNAEEDEGKLLAIDELIRKRVQQAKTVRIIPWSRWAVAASLFLCVSIAAFLMLRQPEQKLLEQTDKQVVQSKIPAAKPPVVTESVVRNERAPVLNKAAVDSVQKSAVKNSIAMLKPKLRAAKPEARISEEVLNPSMAKTAPKMAELSVMKAKNDTTLIAANDLSEVAVVGYGAQKKESITSSATTIRIRGSSSVPVNSALEGKIAGVQINQSRARKTVIVKGKVTDADGNTPLPGVAIRLGKEKKGTYTNAKGQFSLEVPENGETLLASAIGFDQKIVKVNGNQDSLNIVLSQSTSALNEVVVVGYGAQRTERKLEKAHPLQGWDAYNKYLKENATVEGEKGGKVTIAFTINQAGTITDLRVVKSSGKPAMDVKALALILTGPEWVGDSDGVTKEIKLKIRFH